MVQEKGQWGPGWGTHQPGSDFATQMQEVQPQIFKGHFTPFKLTKRKIYFQKALHEIIESAES